MTAFLDKAGSILDLLWSVVSDIVAGTSTFVARLASSTVELSQNLTGYFPAWFVAGILVVVGLVVILRILGR